MKPVSLTNCHNSYHSQSGQTKSSKAHFPEDDGVLTEAHIQLIKFKSASTQLYCYLCNIFLSKQNHIRNSCANTQYI